MSYTTDMLEGLAQLLHDAGFGLYRADGVYKAGERGIVVGVFPEHPDEIVTIRAQQPTVRDLSPTAGADLRIVRVQILWRTVGNPLNGVKIFDQLEQLIRGRRLDLNGRIVRGGYVSYGDIGADANGRHQFTSNWTLAGFAPRT